MSLLMDALRKAEADKKRAQGTSEGNETGGGEDPQAVGEATLGTPTSTVSGPAPDSAGTEDMTMEARQVAAPDEEATRQQQDANAADDEPSDAADPGTLSFDQLALEPIEELEAVADEFEKPDPLGDTSTEIPSRVQGETLALEEQEPAPPAADEEPGEDTTGQARRVIGDQTSTLPSMRAVQSDLEDYFDRSRSMEMPRSASERAKAEETLTGTQRMANPQTVFDAGQREKRNNPLVIGASIIGVLLIVGFAAVAFFFFQQTPAPPPMVSPSVATQVEQSGTRELSVTPIETRSEDTSESLVRIDVTTPEAPTTEEVVDEAVTPEGEQVGMTDTPQNVVTASAEVSASADDSSAQSPGAFAPETLIAAAEAQMAPLPAPPTETLEVPDSGALIEGAGGAPRSLPRQMEIERKVVKPTIDSDVVTGYEAFQAGDFEKAVAAYAAAAARDPENRDALLGIGAIKIAQGDYAAAYQAYSKALKIDPNNPVATAAIYEITGAREADIATLKVLVDRSPDNPYLHFAIGNWYSRKGRWPEAQRAYFEAVARDAEDPDYAYNLAVSLDRMGQSPAALQYYEKAAALADQSGGNFEIAQLLARIRTLGAATAR